MTPIGIVGVGKIARDQHVPAIAASDAFTLVATASRHGTVAGIPGYPTIGALLAGPEQVRAVALCQPPQVRFAAAAQAIAAGVHVFLEKPPGATLSEVEALVTSARAGGVTLFASWHSQYAPAVEPARTWLAGRRIRRVAVAWKEDVRHWHPGQAWIWQPGGFGVFDPGINALSIASRILPPIRWHEAELAFPANRDAPIAATLAGHAGEAPIDCVFDWRQTGPQSWDIAVETDGGILMLAKGGAEMVIDGVACPLPGEAEYAGLYARFAALIERGESDCDVAPLRLVADAMLIGRRVTVEPFED